MRRMRMGIPRRGARALWPPAESAFSPSIYEPLSPESYLTLFADASDFVRIVSRRELGRELEWPFTPVHDASLAFYKPATAVRRSLRRPEELQGLARFWRRVMERITSSEEYARINAVTAGRPELAALAAARALVALVKEDVIEEPEPGEDGPVGVCPLPGGRCRGGGCQGGQGQGGGGGGTAVPDPDPEAVGKALREAAEEVEEAARDLDEADVAMGIIKGKGGSGAGKGFSIREWLENPAEFRKRLVRLKAMVKAYKLTRSHLEVEPSRPGGAPSRAGGYEGLRLGGLEEATPTELAMASERVASALGEAGELYRLLKLRDLLEKRALAWEKRSEPPVWVYVDASGSMDNASADFAGYRKFDVAAGVALALLRRYRDSRVHLFDTMVRELPAKPAEAVAALLRAEASGGTDISAVLRHAMENAPRGVRVVVITDGIDTVSEELVRRAVATGLAERTTIILIPPGERRSWMKPFNVAEARDIASLARAAARAARAP